MHSQGSGHIINLASIGAHEVEPTAAVYSVTKFAVWAISEGLRQEHADGVRVSVISPGVTESELAESISDPARESMRNYRAVAIPASAVAEAIAFAIAQPSEADVNEIIVRPAASTLGRQPPPSPPNCARTLHGARTMRVPPSGWDRRRSQARPRRPSKPMSPTAKAHR